jgi:hypothetical protein
MRPVTQICASCKKSFTRMQQGLLLPIDMNPYCTICTRKKLIGLGTKLKNAFKRKPF